MRQMKESDIDWIGIIPCTWNVKPISTCFKERNEKVSDTEWEPLSVTKQGIVKQLETAAKSDAHDDRKKVCKNDFVINSRSDRKQSCGVSPYDGSVSLINIVLENKALNNDYVRYLLKNHGFAEEFYRYGSGIVADLWSTNYQKMKKIMIPIPPKEEQFKIAKVLDSKISEINNIIEKTNKTIEDYKKYKKSIITELITKGLDKNAKMKETNVESIGKIPSHWKLLRNKFIANSFTKGNGITKEDVKENGNIQCIRYGEIYSKYDNYFSNTYSKTNIDNIANPTYINKGDLLFAGTGELVEEIGKNVLYEGEDNCIAGGDIIIMKHNQNARFINYALNSISSQEQKSKGKAKLKVVHISASDIGNIMVAIPPIKEQIEIANYLDKINDEINSIINNKQKIVEELEDYKKSLIYEYVKRKKEVV